MGEADLADVAERVGLSGEGEAAVLAGDLVRAMNPLVAGVAERGLVGAAEHRGLFFEAHAAEYLHRAPFAAEDDPMNRSLEPPAVKLVFSQPRK